MKYYKIIVIAAIGVLLIYLMSSLNILSRDGIFLMWVALAFIILIATIVSVVSYSNAIQNREKWSKKIIKKDITEEFKSVYTYIYDNYANELKKLRKRLIKVIINTVIIIIFSYIISWFIISYVNKSDILLLEILRATLSNKRAIIIPAIPGIIYSLKYGKYNDEYQKKYKETVVKKFVESLYNNLTYKNYENNKLETFYKDADFLEKKHPKFASNDYISGSVNNTYLEMSDAIIINWKNRIMYKRLFSFSKINKNIPGKISIKNNKTMNIVQDNRIQIDYSEFEKYFDVFCDSSILAMQILTHDIMEDMINFYNNIGLDFEIVIKENRVYIKYDVGDIFEGEVIRKSTNIKTLWIFYNIIEFSINLTQKMNKVLDETEV